LVVSESLSEEELQTIQESVGEDPRDDTEPWSDRYTVTNSTEQRVAESLEVLEAISESLCLSVEHRSQAAKVFATIAKQNLVDGRPTELVIAGAIRIAGRELQRPIPIDRIAREIGVERRTLARLIRRLREESQLGQPDCGPEDYVWYIARELELDESTQQSAQDLIEEANRNDLVVGRSPSGIAGAAVYLAAQGARTQRAVADAAGVTRETLRVRLKEYTEANIHLE
jgi:transcription initiation factor TFIIIB Brf1 subunit/transcription initiation factor TFIIB